MENNLIIVKDIPMIYVNLIVILITFSEGHNFRTARCSYSPSLYCYT